MNAEQAESKRVIGLACRILAHQGLAEDVLGHVSVRTSTDRLLVRCRGPHERGLLFTTEQDVHEVSLDYEDNPVNLADGYQAPNELPVHTEVLRARPDATAVVHVHPPAVVAADLAGVALRPIVGAYNIPAMRMARDGIPVYPRGVLIRRASLGAEVAETLGDKQVCLLHAHGIVAVGESVEQAVVRALNVDALARLTMRTAAAATDIPNLAAEDIAELPDLGSAFNDGHVWRHHVARLEHAGLAI